MINFKVVAVAVFLFTLFLLAMNAASRAEDVSCPPGVPSCKVITISPDEERVLVGPAAIFDSAEFANRMNLAGPIQYWRNKLASAPEVKAKPVEPKPAVPKPEPKK